MRARRIWKRVKTGRPGEGAPGLLSISYLHLGLLFYFLLRP